nr:methyltransferase [Atopomonas sediminilitoris]
MLDRFHALDQWLFQQQNFWQEAPFTHQQLSWEAQHPELGQWLRQQSLEHAEHYQGQPHALLNAPAPFAELAEQAQRLSSLGPHPQHPSHTIPARFAVDVPGRKWQQIEAFARCLPPPAQTVHWLDWCSGKSHLGRHLLHRLGGKLTSLEWDAALVEQAQQLSAKHQLTATHRIQDVLAESCQQHVSAQHSPIALHACGDLHLQLLRLASRQGCPQLAVAPCCYNRIASHDYQPLSQTARGAQLALTRSDLRLTLRESVNAGQRDRRLRDQSMARRLAFDQLCRERLGQTDYQSTPAAANKWLHLPFHQWANRVAEHMQRPLTLDSHDDEAEALGWQRLAQIRNLELVGNLFRRPLELWLLLDRALFLHEQGYHTRLGTFCPRELTPRNALLLATKSD